MSSTRIYKHTHTQRCVCVYNPLKYMCYKSKLKTLLVYYYTDVNKSKTFSKNIRVYK